MSLDLAAGSCGHRAVDVRGAPPFREHWSGAEEKKGAQGPEGEVGECVSPSGSRIVIQTTAWS